MSNPLIARKVIVVLPYVLPYVKRYGHLLLLILGGAALFFYFVLCMFIGTILGMFDVQGGFLSGRPTPLAESQIGSGKLLQLFQLAQEETNVSWAVLAAIAKIESDFGRNMGPSSEGAIGFMQFMPTTWSGSRNSYAKDDPKNPMWDEDPERIRQYGGYGIDRNGDGRADPFNPEDAIASAARYLKANGFEHDPRKALWHYNHDYKYVNDVLQLAESYASSMIPVSNSDGMWPLPAQYTQISSGFGPRILYGASEYHEGIDIPCPIGTPVFAVLPGKVLRAGWLGNGGYGVVLAHENNTQTIYCHFSEVAVREGQVVEQGSVIGLSGNTGRSTGPHLHFGVKINGRPCDPEEWLQAPTENF